MTNSTPTPTEPCAYGKCKRDNLLQEIDALTEQLTLAQAVVTVAKEWRGMYAKCRQGWGDEEQCDKLLEYYDSKLRAAVDALTAAEKETE